LTSATYRQSQGDVEFNMQGTNNVYLDLTGSSGLDSRYSFENHSHGYGDLPMTSGQASNWDTAYTERRQWDGGNANLNAGNARTNLNVLEAGTGANQIRDNVALDGRYALASSLSDYGKLSAENTWTKEQIFNSGDGIFQFGRTSWTGSESVFRNNSNRATWYANSSTVTSGWGFRTHSGGSSFNWALTIDHNGNTIQPGTSEASNHIGGSDRRLKSDFQELSALNYIRQSGPLYSYLKEGIEGREIGMVAQDLMHIPDMVHTRKHEKYGEVYGLSGLSVASMAWAGVKELDLEIAILKEKIQRLEALR
jgi:hypothetical protein